MKDFPQLKIYLVFVAIVLCNALAFTQTAKLKLFTDCRCDRNYIRQELSYVNHVRDQALADVQLFITDIGNGGGGRTYDLTFTGRNAFQGLKKEITFKTSPTMTSDEVRIGLTQKIVHGLLPYLIKSGTIDQLEITISGQNQDVEQQIITEDDPWNNWIFEVYGEGSLDKESSRSSTSVELGFESDRVTEDWRIRLDMEVSHSESHFESDEEEYTSVRQRHFAYGSIVRSLSNHWSAGIFSGVSHNTYRNLDLSYHFRPAIEYNFYPYSEVLRREITFAYKVGYIRNNYLQETIYGRMEEDLFSQSLDIEMRFRQPWGNISTNLEFSTFLHDFSKNRIDFYSYISVRIIKGLAVRVSTNLQLVRDQLNLPVGDASIEDILLRQRQIATDFEMGLGVGLSYTFGSAFNNIVNTRL